MAEEVRAPLAGNILNVLVAPGAKVQEDDELLVIEALKMENLVYSPCSGTVKEIKVAKGDKVAEDDVLVVDAFSGDAIPAHLLTREAFENAIRVNAAIGGSTNAILLRPRSKRSRPLE